MMLSVQTHLMTWWPSIIASVLCVRVFFSFEKLQRLAVNAGAWFPCGEAVLKVSWLRWIAGGHILYKAGLENVNHLLQ